MEKELSYVRGRGAKQGEGGKAKLFEGVRD
jgi:hypothetical protein